MSTPLATINYVYKRIAQPEVLRSALMQQIDKFDEDKIKKQATEMANAIAMSKYRNGEISDLP